jgi:ABC-type multidrug transport system fused ATPase/permease subunit
MYMRTARDRMRPLTRPRMGQEAVASASRVFEVLDRDDLVRGPAEPRRLPPKGGDLRIEASASPTDGRQVLDGSTSTYGRGSLSFGRTGSGKTSLVHLIPRFYDPTRGRILDGIDVSDLDPADPRPRWASCSRSCSSSPPRWREVATVGLATREASSSACGSRRPTFVSALPRLHTMVGERGVSLSGGQRCLTIAWRS